MTALSTHVGCSLDASSRVAVSLLFATTVVTGTVQLHVPFADPVSVLGVASAGHVLATLPFLVPRERERPGEGVPANPQGLSEGRTEGLLVLDADDRVVRIDASARRLLAVGDEEAIGRRFDSVIARSTTRLEDSADSRIPTPPGTAGGAESVESNPERTDGGVSILPENSDEPRGVELVVEHDTERRLRVLSTPLLEAPDANGRAVVLRDVTETRELEAKLDRLTLANDLLRTQLRNDARVIHGWADRLRDRLDGDDRAGVDSILDASRHVFDLTDTAAKLDDVLAGQRTERRTPIDLGVVLESELRRFRNDHVVDLTVNWRVPENGSLTVAGTPMLDSVFDHLLSNAVVHTDEDTPRVAVTVDYTDERATVSIADDGFGMSDRQKEFVLDPHADAETPADIGTGLYFVATVLEGIDGTIHVEDAVPRGTAVTVALDRL